MASFGGCLCSLQKKAAAMLKAAPRKDTRGEDLRPADSRVSEREGRVCQLNPEPQLTTRLHTKGA